jgi:hypothetical protein
MAKEEFEIEVDRDGKVTIRTIGIKGARCVDAAEALAKLIGREQARELTAEYYETDQNVSGQVDVRHRY